ncbi:MAG: aldo/keto reductase, partial [Prevotellaceae bacterium]|nr:aldo/keto reductase [Prevotellaceae bacterium]
MEHNNINRRAFLKVLGGATVAATVVTACGKGERGKFNRRQARLSGKISGEMTYRTNCKNGDKISLLGYGCMRWSLRKKADGTEEVDQEEVNKLVDTAIERGINFFDTAPVYVQGWSETATGIALSRHPREKYFISTKMSNFSPAARSLEGSKAMYEKSFRDLQVDYIDYYFLHSVGNMDAWNDRFINNGVLDFLQKEKEKGKIRNIGWSFHGEVEFFDYMMSLYDSGEFKLDFAMIQHNYVDYRHASGRNVNSEYLNSELSKRNIPTIIMEPLRGGTLASLNEHLTAQMKQREPEMSIASWAFRFAGMSENIITVLSGMTYMEHLLDNIAAFSPLVPLSGEELDMLEHTARIMLHYPTVPCTYCQYCMPCPYGVDIPGIFDFYNRSINAGNVPSSAQDPNYRRARRRFLIGYDRGVAALRQAKHCISCDECVQHCPQSI